MKKRRYIYITVYVAAVIIAFILFAKITKNSVKVFEDEYENLSASRTDMAANFISSYLTGYTNTLSGIAETEAARLGLKNETANLYGLIDMISTGSLTSDYVENIIFLNEDMEVLLSAKPLTVSLSEQDENWIRKAAFGTLISDAIEGNLEDEEYFIAAVPVFENRELLGFIASKISFRVFSSTQGNLSRNSDSSFILFDGAGNSVQLNTGTPSDYTYSELQKSEESGLIPNTYFVSESKIYLNGADSEWKVFYLLSGKNLYNAFNIIFSVVVCACIILILLGFFILYRYSADVLKPIDTVIRELEVMNESKSYAPIEIKKGNRYLAGAVKQINKMAENAANGDTAMAVMSKRYGALFMKKRAVFLKWDLANSTFAVSPFYKEIFGTEFVPYVGSDFTPESLYIHPDDAENYTRWIKDIRLGRKTQPIVYRRKTADGKYRYFEHTFVIVNDDMGNPVEALGLIIDVDRFTRKEIALKRAAELDRFTGAYNKYSFLEILKQRYNEAMAGGESLCVSIIKLHNFYDLEDKRLSAGEEALRFIVNVVTENINCVVGRILSDSLGIIGPPENVSFFADEIAKELDLGFVFPETNEHYNVKTTAALYFTDSLDIGYEDFVKRCSGEYERFAEGPGNDYFFKK
ncbi:MAG: PAS domain-containing protein [Clostridiales bacterium]|nr:PAS domain-containing protein [Clostridiales bacterium]